MYDFSARHILEELGSEFHERAKQCGRQAFLIAESDLNDVRVINPTAVGGFGIDAQWSDDFHHSARAVVSGETNGYFSDFGRIADLRKAITEGFVYDGTRSRYRRRRHGNSSAQCPGHQLVVYMQNHDQVANASHGNRLSTLVGFEQQKLAAALLCVTPNLPLVFMGQEFGETAPFHYFVSHSDPALINAVRNGRKKEFNAFGWEREFLDPQSPATFEASKLDWSRTSHSPHTELLRLYRDLLELRRRIPALAGCRKDLTRVYGDEERRFLVVERRDPAGASVLALFNLFGTEQPIPVLAAIGCYRLLLATSDPLYAGPKGVDRPPEMIEIIAQQTPAILCPGWGALLYALKEIPYCG
jgi:maltooligosyltrehalose trehalohydrolase